MQDKRLKLQFKEFIDNHRKEITIVGATVLSAAVLVIGLSFMPGTIGGGKSVPQEFIDSRVRAGDAANRISDLTSTYKDNLESIAEAERNGEYSKGIGIITDEITKNEKVRDIAGDLAEELNSMAKDLDKIQPEKARSVALKAVTTGIDLVQNIITYTNDSNHLLDLLKNRFQNGGDANRTEIENLISTLNGEADVINKLGSEYRGLMVQFDGLTQ